MNTLIVGKAITGLSAYVSRTCAAVSIAKESAMSIPSEIAGRFRCRRVG